jgi:hypothetical protein
MPTGTFMFLPIDSVETGSDQSANSALLGELSRRANLRADRARP